MSFSPLMMQLVNALRCLPGVGPKSAQRMAFHVLSRDRLGGQHLVDILARALSSVGHCQICRILSETKACQLCADTSRDNSILCVVESPADVMAIEHTGGFRGKYFVLMGHLSPIDGVGPDDIGIDLLNKRLTSAEVKELILATNPTVEGEATAHYISELAKAHQIKATRIAHGVPLGGELEFVDGVTLAEAMHRRTVL